MAMPLHRTMAVSGECSYSAVGLATGTKCDDAAPIAQLRRLAGSKKACPPAAARPPRRSGQGEEKNCKETSFTGKATPSSLHSILKSDTDHEFEPRRQSHRSRTTKETKKRVRLNPKMRVRLCLHLSDYDPAEIESTWYSQAEDEGQMKDILINVRLHRARSAHCRHPLDDGRELCVRGLEHMLCSRTGERRKEMKREIVRAVLQVQRRFLLGRGGNGNGGGEESESSPEERIAAACSSAGSLAAAEEARQRGERDEADADVRGDRHEAEMNFLSGTLGRALSLGGAAAGARRGASTTPSPNDGGSLPGSRALRMRQRQRRSNGAAFVGSAVVLSRAGAHGSGR